MILHVQKKRTDNSVENSYSQLIVDLHFKLYLRSVFTLALKELPLTNLRVSCFKWRGKKENASYVLQPVSK